MNENNRLPWFIVMVGALGVFSLPRPGGVSVMPVPSQTQENSAETKKTKSEAKHQKTRPGAPQVLETEKGPLEMVGEFFGNECLLLSEEERKVRPWCKARLKDNGVWDYHLKAFLATIADPEDSSSSYAFDGFR